MNLATPLPKRIRRAEVSTLALTESLIEIRDAQHAIYDAIVLISKRLQCNAGDSTPADILMQPPWYRNPATGHVLPPPPGFDIQQYGLGALRVKLGLLNALQRAEIQRSQKRISDLLEKLKKREAERVKNLGEEGSIS